MDENGRLLRKLDRERRARQEAESLLEERSRELFEANEDLRRLNESLEQRVHERTYLLSHANERLQDEIDERIRAERLLRLTQFTVDRAGDAVFWIDAESRLTYVNDSACHSLGYTRDELLSKRMWEIDSQLTPESWKLQWADFCRQSSATIETRYARGDGQTFPVEVAVSFIQFDDFEYACAFVRDVTEQKLAEAEVRKLAMVAARTDNAVVITDALGNIEWTNEGFTRITGFAFDEVVGRTPGSFLQGEDTSADTVQNMRDCIRAGSGFKAEVVNYAKDGRKYWIAIEVQPMLSSDGRVTHFMAVESDITERKRAEERLGIHAEVLEEIATGGAILHVLHQLCMMIEAAIPGSICTTMMLNESTGKSQVLCAPSMSEAMQQALDGMTPESDVGSSGVGESPLTPVYVADCQNDPGWTSWHSVARQYDLRSLWSHPIRVEREIRGHFTIVHSEVIHPTKHQRALLDVAANLAGVALTRHRDEERLKQARTRAESASRAKSEFLANMSHEIRTPITAITGYADLLSDTEGRSSQDVIWAQQIVTSAEHLRLLLNDVLDLSKVEAGQLSVEQNPCNPTELVDEVAAMYRPRASEKLLDFGVIRGKSVPDWIASDATRIRQILTNLVSNAIKFTTHGEIQVRLEMSEINAEQELLIHVSDTGIGMTPKQASKLFQPFQRLHQESRPTAGTGLGLAISKRLAELMGGRLEIESRPRQGSCFTLALPARTITADELAISLEKNLVSHSYVGQTNLAGRLNGAQILLVEDTLENRNIFSHMLSPSGANLRSVLNGRQAIDTVLAEQKAGRKFDMILMDMQMPVMDGFEATAALRQAQVDTPIIALTAYAMPSDRSLCLEAGCNDFLAKPVLRKELIDKIAQVLENCSVGGSATSPQDTKAAPQVESERENARKSQFALLVSKYRGSLQSYLADLSNAENQKDLKGLSTLTHRLKGTASSFGFPEISDAAAQCNEGLAQGKDVVAISEDLKLLRSYIEDAVGQEH